MESSEFLVEDLNEQAVADTVAENIRVQALQSDRFQYHDITNVQAAFDFKVLPEYMRETDGTIINRDQCVETAEQIISGLYDSNPDWYAKSEKIVLPISSTVNNTYWSFNDGNGFPWYVVEIRDTNAKGRTLGISAHASMKMPKDYKDHLTTKNNQ